MNRIQQIGMKHYAEFRERMPRDEVEEIERRVREREGVAVGVVSSRCHGEGEEGVSRYKRGTTSGDVWVLQEREGYLW